MGTVPPSLSPQILALCVEWLLHTGESSQLWEALQVTSCELNQLGPGEQWCVYKGKALWRTLALWGGVSVCFTAWLTLTKQEKKHLLLLQSSPKGWKGVEVSWVAVGVSTRG